MRFAGLFEHPVMRPGMETGFEHPVVRPGDPAPEYKHPVVRPAPASFDPSTLDMTVPEMRPGPFYPGQDLDRDRHILFNLGSGIS